MFNADANDFLLGVFDHEVSDAQSQEKKREKRPVRIVNYYISIDPLPGIRLDLSKDYNGWG